MPATFKTDTNIIAREFFQVTLATYLFLTLAETVKPGFVSNFFNSYYLLLVLLVTGVAMVVTEPIEGRVRQAVEKAAVTVAEQAAKLAPPAMRPRLHQYADQHRDNVIDLRGTVKPKLSPRQIAERQVARANKNRHFM